ncbi:MAG: right-handed parallel beta-helix repeat-containing protein [Candidatus Nealsonbacteria bacterium]|nr:right-handed parallel beta-helix repeat-containing protein [Candidatus Nealsonbacteria bacterium]
MRGCWLVVVAVAWGVGGLAAEGEEAARLLWVDGGSRAADEDGSATMPFRTIGAAMKVVRPGDTVTVRGGVYREQVKIPAGEPGKPITLRAADGERAVVSGCVPVTGWEKTDAGLWTTVLDFEPAQLLVGSQVQPIAREPNEGWWKSTAIEGNVLADPRHLEGMEADETGGEVRVWLQHGNVFHAFPIVAFNAQTGRVTLETDPAKTRLTDGDTYYLQNRAQWIDRPGEWAVEPLGEPDAARFRIFFKPPDEDALQRVEAPRTAAALVSVRDGAHVLIEGLEVTGSRQYAAGIELYGARDVTVRRCIVHHNEQYGISLRDTIGCTAARNVVRHNGYGISVSSSSGVLIEENDVGYGTVDGIVIAWKSDDVTVRRNYVHHHLLWGHPDNLQVYRGVSDVRFEDNLLLAAGQSVMMEETRDGRFTGNMVVGCTAYMLIFGHGNAGHYLVQGNTLALSGYGCMNLTWEDYDVRENVMMTGHGSALFGTKGITGYRADRNLFWNTARAKNAMIIATADGWHRDFESVRRSTGQDRHSVYAGPRFRNAPVAMATLDHRRLHESTRGRWYLRGGTGLFRGGDYIEVNFDGVRRRVIRIDAASITVVPPLAEKPIKDWLIANWGQKTDFRLDLRLASGSPGAKLSATGGPVGSQIDVTAYRRGDFNGDGRRDLPTLPPGFPAKSEFHP